MIIAIDGPSGTGKSTVARGVAQRLGFTFFDTGAMYRAVAWQVLKEGIDPSDEAKVAEMLPSFTFHIRTRGERAYFVGQYDVTKEIRSQQIAAVASQVAAYAEVRKTLVEIQRKFGEQTDAVFEGRDMGTVVFPNADLKIFLTANVQIRTERRYKELHSKFPDLASDLCRDRIQKEIQERDENDSNRTISPLRQAKDAILIDTSYLTVDQVIEKIVRLKPKRKKRYAPMKWPYFLVYWTARIFFRLCFRLKIYGLEHFRSGSGVLAANHVSFYDPQVLSISCPEEVHFLAKQSLFTIPLLGRLIRCLNSHPVSRGASDAQTFKLILHLLAEGKKVILFPEGSRSETGQLLPFERGLGFLVQKAECRIFPVYLYGTYEAWPIQKKWPKLFGKMACIFGSPIEWEEFVALDKKTAQQAVAERTEQALTALKAWYEAGAQGNPP
jgi:cytidylate kinase